MARALHQLGVKNGDYMGYALTDHAWAYMAGVRIVSEIPVEDVLSFWAANDEQKAQSCNGLHQQALRLL